jgi:hypothetical protein
LIDVRFANYLALAGAVIVLLVNIMPTPIYGQQGSEELQSYEVNQDGHSFDVSAFLSNGGSLTGVQVFPETGSILISIETGSEDDPSELRIVLPRELIDARDGENDSEFFIIVEGEEAEYTELRTTETEREIEVSVTGGATQVEIFGTHIVPEFQVGLVVLPISLGIVLTALGIAKLKFHR